MTNSSDQENPSTEKQGRRSFLTVSITILSGAVAMLTPLAVGIVTFLSPLFRRSQPPEVRIALLNQVNPDGRPQLFPVCTDREDAWNRYPAQKIGAVYLIRLEGSDVPVAFTAKCPHAGCYIGYTAGDEYFRCPCHTSNFNLDGSRSKGDAEVSPRDMDELPVKLKKIKDQDGQEVTEVWVEFIDYQTGKKEKVPTI